MYQPINTKIIHLTENGEKLQKSIDDVKKIPNTFAKLETNYDFALFSISSYNEKPHTNTKIVSALDDKYNALMIIGLKRDFFNESGIIDIDICAKKAFNYFKKILTENKFFLKDSKSNNIAFVNTELAEPDSENAVNSTPLDKTELFFSKLEQEFFSSSSSKIFFDNKEEKIGYRLMVHIPFENYKDFVQTFLKKHKIAFSSPLEVNHKKILKYLIVK